MRADTTAHQRTIGIRPSFGTKDSYTLTVVGAEVRQTLLNDERFSLRRPTLLNVYNYLKITENVW
jgi:hypothetical protein